MSTSPVSAEDVVRQGIADGEVVTTKPINRALLNLLDENERLRRALKKLADEADLGLVTDALMQEVSDLTGMEWVK